MLLLIEMLKQNPNFGGLQVEQQEVFARLAAEFEENELALYLSPSELSNKLGVGNRFQWQDFLNLEPVRQYIKGQMGAQAEVASRKTFNSLVQSGMAGEVQAIKQINELSGIMNSGDKNKVVVLHQINRPKIIREVQSK